VGSDDRTGVDVDLLSQALRETAAIAEYEAKQRWANQSPLVFVAGPYTADTPEETLANVRAAMAAGLTLRRYGFVPLIPHLLHFLHEYNNETGGPEILYEGWMAITLRYVLSADAIYIVAPSPGTNREVDLARAHNKPVYRTYRELKEHFPERD